MGDDIQFERVSRYLIHGKADAVDADGTLFRHVARVVFRDFDRETDRPGIGITGHYATGAIDMAADQVTAQALTQADGGLEVDRRTDTQAAKRSHIKRLDRNIGVEAVLMQSDSRQADAINGNALADFVVRPWQAI